MVLKSFTKVTQTVTGNRCYITRWWKTSILPKHTDGGTMMSFQDTDPIKSLHRYLVMLVMVFSPHSGRF